MVKTYTDAKYHFTETFDDADGTYIRSDVTEGPEKGHDPFMRSFPALMDIGIMGHCAHGKSGLCAKSGIQCYQSGQTMEAPNMTLENYARLVSEAEEKGCFQVTRTCTSISRISSACPESMAWCRILLPPAWG